MSRRAWLLFIALMAYLLLTVAGVTHKDLLLNTAITLPVLQVSIEMTRFFLFAPILLVLLHLGVMGQLVQLARKTLEHGGSTDATRISYAFRRTLGRSPTAAEKSELMALLETQRNRIADGWINANELATGKNEPAKDLPKNITPTQLAAYTVVSRVLLNLDETITKE